MVGGIIIGIIYLLIVIFLLIVPMWKIYTKAGQPGWAILIPIYNLIVLFKIVGKPWWRLFLFFIPIVNYVFVIWTINLLSKSFGKNVGFTLGLLFLGIIFYPILGYGKAQYIGPAGAKKEEPAAPTTTE